MFSGKPQGSAFTKQTRVGLILKSESMSGKLCNVLKKMDFYTNDNNTYR